MKLQKLYALTTFILLIVMIFAHSMEENYAEVALQAEQFHSFHPLLCLPREIQHQIIFPCYKIDRFNMDALKEVAQTFFKFNILSKNFHNNFKLPWSNLELAKKNEMLKKIIYCMTLTDYNQYRMVPLLLIYSGADVDIKPENYSTCLETAVSEDDEEAVAFLLNQNADPYQLYGEKVPMCFYATTHGILNLFLEKVDKDKLLNQSKHAVAWMFLQNWYPPDIMAFWLDYGVSHKTAQELEEESMAIV